MTPAPPTPAPAPRTIAVVLLVSLLTVAVLVAIGWDRPSELGARQASAAYYNRLVEGFRAGQLSLKLDVPPGLAALPDPHDPAANADFRGHMYVGENRLHDLSYFRGRLYLYFGVTPALVLFWPFTALTGGHLSHAQAATLFAIAGFLGSVWLLTLAHRRFFPAASPLALAFATGTLGLGSVLPQVLSRPDVWEVPVTCACALVVLALIGVWHALHDPARRSRHLVLASTAFGLALGARPSLLFGAVILLVPVAAAWRTASARERGRMFGAALGPVAALGLGLLLYNHLRFGSPFEFGQRYQLLGERHDGGYFGLAYLWPNLRDYFLVPAGWEFSRPFVRLAGGKLESAYGLLANMPAALLALALPFAWHGTRGVERAPLRLFSIAAAGLFLTSAAVICLFFGNSARYQLEFSPALLLLAAAGILALEEAYSGHPGALRAAQGAVAVLTLGSVAFSLLAAVRLRAELEAVHGAALLADNQAATAIPHYESALRLAPASLRARAELALARFATGQDASARADLAAAAESDSDGVLYGAYGPYLVQSNRLEAALVLLQAALRAHSTVAGLHNDAGALLMRLGRPGEARPRFEEAARLAPRDPAILANHALALARAGETAAARDLFGRVLQLDPSSAVAREMLNRLPP